MGDISGLVCPKHGGAVDRRKGCLRCNIEQLEQQNRDLYNEAAEGWLKFRRLEADHEGMVLVPVELLERIHQKLDFMAYHTEDEELIALCAGIAAVHGKVE